MSLKVGDACAKYNSENDLILQQLFIGYLIINLYIICIDVLAIPNQKLRANSIIDILFDNKILA